ncbi:hypothetical protein DVH05_016413 [Phytophthora capsici]|nr:hypothetical protein DVH05_016413 [Phytophthora capsici]
MGKASKPGRQKKEDAAVVVDGTSTENDAECKPAPFEKCNWAGETTLGLVRAWKKVMTGERRKDEKTSMITQKIFDEYKTAFPTSTRSKKAVEDKLQALREMYRFISDVNVNRIAGSTGKPEWFELSKNERKELRDRHRVKSPNVSQDVYDELHLFLGRQVDTEPLESTNAATTRYNKEDTTNSATSDDTSSIFGVPARTDCADENKTRTTQEKETTIGNAATSMMRCGRFSRNDE